tara:strand:+ start:57877 stop:58041 length:165 start_codon:yes stop_codon:yes gene_type:complete
MKLSNYEQYCNKYKSNKTLYRKANLVLTQCHYSIFGLDLLTVNGVIVISASLQH